MAKEWKRTCKRPECGAVWYVSLKAAKERPSTRMQRAGIKLQASGSRMSPGYGSSKPEMQLLNIEQRDQRVAQNNSCPKCGSQSFTQEKVKV